jgi:hypothetical protein
MRVMKVKNSEVPTSNPARSTDKVFVPFAFFRYTTSNKIQLASQLMPKHPIISSLTYATDKEPISKTQSSGSASRSNGCEA